MLSTTIVTVASLLSKLNLSIILNLNVSTPQKLAFGVYVYIPEDASNVPLSGSFVTVYTIGAPTSE